MRKRYTLLILFLSICFTIFIKYKKENLLHQKKYNNNKVINNQRFKSCSNDKKRLCKGRKDLSKCLREHSLILQPKCIRKIELYLKRPEIEKNDKKLKNKIKKKNHCTNEKLKHCSQAERILRKKCIIEKMNLLSKKCQTKLKLKLKMKKTTIQQNTLKNNLSKYGINCSRSDKRSCKNYVTKYDKMRCLFSKRNETTTDCKQSLLLYGKQYLKSLEQQ